MYKITITTIGLYHKRIKPAIAWSTQVYAIVMEKQKGHQFIIDSSKRMNSVDIM
jgi:hypothetical protein